MPKAISTLGLTGGLLVGSSGSCSCCRRVRLGELRRLIRSSKVGGRGGSRSVESLCNCFWWKSELAGFGLRGVCVEFDGALLGSFYRLKYLNSLRNLFLIHKKITSSCSHSYIHMYKQHNEVHSSIIVRFSSSPSVPSHTRVRVPSTIPPSISRGTLSITFHSFHNSRQYTNTTPQTQSHHR